MIFTSDWFTQHIPAWEKHLAKFKGVPCRAIELGSYEGRSAVWLLENILTHEESKLICVDIKFHENIYDNLSGFTPKVRVVQSGSIAHLIEELDYDFFDIAYIDANHTAKDVIMEAGLLWPMMCEGGIMIFDDYGNTAWTARDAVDFFIKHWSLESRVIHKGHQVFIQC